MSSIASVSRVLSLIVMVNDRCKLTIRDFRTEGQVFGRLVKPCLGGLEASKKRITGPPWQK